MQTGPVTLLTVFLNLQKWRPRNGRKFYKSRMTRLFAFDTGGCEGCAMELGVLQSGIFALEGSGFQFVTRPEDADWLLVTGMVTRHAAPFLQTVWQAMPSGRSLVAVGDCAISGGLFTENYAALEGLEKLSQGFYEIPGCPPSPGLLLQTFISLEEDMSFALLSASRRRRQ